jgi:hypothetical protein
LELKGIYASFVGQVKGQIQQSAIRACVEWVFLKSVIWKLLKYKKTC